MPKDSKRRDLRARFDRAAGIYQRTRPVCPPQVFDDLVRLAALGPGARVAEIGCGTGQATVPLAERGMAITAVELGAGLATIARRRLAGFPSAEVLTTSFEDWNPDSARFDAIVGPDGMETRVSPSSRAGVSRGCALPRYA
jgi:protein-L-isoaspartate O-methyltransferase